MDCGKGNAPEKASGVPSMAADLFPEARGVANIFQGQLLCLKPFIFVEGTERLLSSRYHVFVLSLTYKHSKGWAERTASP